MKTATKSVSKRRGVSSSLTKHRRSESSGKPSQVDLQPELLTFRDVSRLLGVNVSTLYRWLDDNRFPAPIRLGPGTLRWRRQTVEAWIVAKEAEAEKGGQE